MKTQILQTLVTVQCLKQIENNMKCECNDMTKSNSQKNDVKCDKKLILQILSKISTRKAKMTKYYKKSVSSKESKQSVMDKDLMDYKIFVFDLDNTLYLHKIANRLYHNSLPHNLQVLKDNNKKLYVATHHTFPFPLLETLGIQDMFDNIIYERKDVHSESCTIDDYTSKQDMINEILLESGSQYTVDDVVFFDDHYYNIEDVSSMGVRCIYVDELKGVDFEEIYDKN